MIALQSFQKPLDSAVDTAAFHRQGCIGGTVIVYVPEHLVHVQRSVIYRIMQIVAPVVIVQVEVTDILTH